MRAGEAGRTVKRAGYVPGAGGSGSSFWRCGGWFFLCGSKRCSREMLSASLGECFRAEHGTLGGGRNATGYSHAEREDTIYSIKGK